MDQEWKEHRTLLYRVLTRGAGILGSTKDIEWSFPVSIVIESSPTHVRWSIKGTEYNYTLKSTDVEKLTRLIELWVGSRRFPPTEKELVEYLWFQLPQELFLVCRTREIILRVRVKGENPTYEVASAGKNVIISFSEDVLEVLDLTKDIHWDSRSPTKCGLTEDSCQPH